MSDAAIKVDSLSKQYRIGRRQAPYKTIRETLINAARAPFLRASSLLRGQAYGAAGLDETIWALKNVSFEVGEGEVVGIIGRNGAGKTTLLKIISRITEPTEGRVEVYGRVGSLLEVGTGFHPELTGRENIFLNGAILGMKKAEIVDKFDEIVAFAEIEKFIDTPVKFYSSGMYVRLAFAVAAHLEPEILLVDEVLAVGDASFQKKCLGKMGAVAREGRTVLFVSHNMVAVQSLCDRVIWLNDGKIVEDGPARRIVSEYLKTSFSILTEQSWSNVAEAPGDGKFRLHRAAVKSVGDSSPDSLTIRTPLLLEFEYWNLSPGTHLDLSLHLYNEEGVRIFNSVPVREQVWHGRPFPVGLFRSICRVPGDLLNDGKYRVQLLAVRDQRTVAYRYDDILVFEVRDAVEMRGEWHGKWVGAVRPDLKWSTELVKAGLPAE